MNEEEYSAKPGKRMGEAQKMSAIVLEVLKENDMGRHLLEHRAVDLWRVVTGPTVVGVTRNVYVKDGVMFVELQSSVVRNELLMLKNKILDNINSAVGQDVIQDIVLK